MKISKDALVAQLDRALPSEGRGHRFESCRVHHLYIFYKLLADNDLVQTAEQFSKNWVGKNKGWFAYTHCKGRDFSTDAALNTLRETRKHKQMLAPKVQQLGVMATDTLEVLDTIEQLIEQHLERKHKIKQRSF